MGKIENHPNLSYRLINNITGWVVFFIASLTYILTAEPTASLWDCSEFIATSAGLQVGHPPGAPLFMIIGRLFAIFAPGPDKQALMINYMSALASGFTILFLFWTITHFARKLVRQENTEFTLGQVIAIMGAGAAGALAYAFSDTFWFSAVEAEVYALSSLFTAVVFWAITKWENVADEPHANRWLILIAYLMGLSIGVHLLNLLAIPALVFVYYFKKYTPTKKGIIWTSILSVVILGFINFMLIPGIIKIGCWFELLFVNGFGLPFNTGVIVYALLIIAGLTVGIRYTLRNHKTVLNTIFTCLVVILIGYSSYSMVVIRSISNPPIDEGSPDNVFALLDYVNREQYGSSPLLFGQYYNAPSTLEEGNPNYFQNKQTGKYEISSYKMKEVFDSRFRTFFPRMHSSRHASQYEQWAGKPKGPVYYTSEKEALQVPSFGNNLKYFFNYQMGHMYWRYFMWNFSGRQNDIQGHGDIRFGNWITGIPLLDEMRLGNQSELPEALKNEKSMNKYYMLPFLLGLLGIFFQYRKNKKGKLDFWVIMLLFFMTGIAIILFLNQTPMEPRERDYAYAGSFYAFAIWIGLGVLAVWEVLNKKLDAQTSAIIASCVCLVAIPANMAKENWDDHDRSGRYAASAHAKNYLSSCAPNAILFTYGDNDTFPLWYVQEVEGFRRDVRVVNLTLLDGGWYADQINRKVYDTDRVPLTLTHDKYRDGVNDAVLVEDRVSSLSAANAIKFVASDKMDTKIRMSSDVYYNVIPSRNIYIPIDSARVIANGMVRPEDADKIEKQINIKLSGSYIRRSQLLLLDMLAANNWERPVYFGIGMPESSFMGLQEYFQLEGVTYRVVPIKTKTDNRSEHGRIDSKILYNNIMKNFQWGNINNPKVNMDYFHDYTVGVMRYRDIFYRLAERLHEEGNDAKAVAVLDKSLEELPVSQVPPSNWDLILYIPLYYELGEIKKGNQVAQTLMKDCFQNLRYFSSLSPEYTKSGMIPLEIRSSVQRLRFISEYAGEVGQTDIVLEINNMLNNFLK